MDQGDPRIGTVLKGKWRLDARLGVGGMATVYAATHRNGKRVAVKVLHPELSRDAGVRERFVREGYVANKVGRGAVTVRRRRRDRRRGRLPRHGAARRRDARGAPRAVAGRPPARRRGAWPRSTRSSTRSRWRTRRASSTATSSPRTCSSPATARSEVLDFGIARLREGSGAEKGATADGHADGDARVHAAGAGARALERGRRAVGPLGGGRDDVHAARGALRARERDGPRAAPAGDDRGRRRRFAPSCPTCRPSSRRSSTAPSSARRRRGGRTRARCRPPCARRSRGVEPSRRGCALRPGAHGGLRSPPPAASCRGARRRRRPSWRTPPRRRRPRPPPSRPRHQSPARPRSRSTPPCPCRRAPYRRVRQAAVGRGARRRSSPWSAWLPWWHGSPGRDPLHRKPRPRP